MQCLLELLELLQYITVRLIWFYQVHLIRCGHSLTLLLLTVSNNKLSPWYIGAISWGAYQCDRLMSNGDARGTVKRSLIWIVCYDGSCIEPIYELVFQKISCTTHHNTNGMGINHHNSIPLSTLLRVHRNWPSINISLLNSMITAYSSRDPIPLQRTVQIHKADLSPLSNQAQKMQCEQSTTKRARPTTPSKPKVSD